MNEIEVLRAQVGLERRHMGAVKNALAQVLQSDTAALQLAFCARCCEYLLFIGERFNAQDQAHVDILLLHVPDDAQDDRSSLEDLARTLQVNRIALQALARHCRALQDGGAAATEGFLEACRRYVAFYDAELRTRKHSVYHLIERYYGVGEWRSAALMSADSILQERQLFAAVRQAAPDGVIIPA